MMEIRNNNDICSANGMICCFSVTGVKTTKMTSIIYNKPLVSTYYLAYTKVQAFKNTKKVHFFLLRK